MRRTKAAYSADDCLCVNPAWAIRGLGELQSVLGVRLDASSIERVYAESELEN
jgi:hypothetical protein